MANTDDPALAWIRETWAGDAEGPARPAGDRVRVGNAPLSYGAFEVTVGVYPNVPGPDELLAEMAAAGYEGTELGPPGYLGEGDELPERLERHGLALTGGWCPSCASASPNASTTTSRTLERTLDLFEAAGAGAARPVFGDAGSAERRANPGAARRASTTAAGAAGPTAFERAQRRRAGARLRADAPSAHVDVRRVAAGDRARARADRRRRARRHRPPAPRRRRPDRVDPRAGASASNYVHVKDVRLDVVRAGRRRARGRARGLAARACSASSATATSTCRAFFDALRDVGYDGWIVVEQDRIPRPDEELRRVGGGAGPQPRVAAASTRASDGAAELRPDRTRRPRHGREPRHRPRPRARAPGRRARPSSPGCATRPTPRRRRRARPRPARRSPRSAPRVDVDRRAPRPPRRARQQRGRRHEPRRARRDRGGVGRGPRRQPQGPLLRVPGRGPVHGAAPASGGS